MSNFLVVKRLDPSKDVKEDQIAWNRLGRLTDKPPSKERERDREKEEERKRDTERDRER